MFTVSVVAESTFRKRVSRSGKRCEREDDGER
jgi:hypothetical protein